MKFLIPFSVALTVLDIICNRQVESFIFLDTFRGTRNCSLVNYFMLKNFRIISKLQDKIALNLLIVLNLLKAIYNSLIIC